MFSSKFRPQKLKTSLRLSINKLKLMQKKKTEMALRARKEIADVIKLGKYDRARIKVEHIIREDYLVEAMELIEMYCELLVTRCELIESKKYCDDGLIEAVTSLIWVFPRVSVDIPELKKAAEQLAIKYGKEFTRQAKSNLNGTVEESLIFKLSPDSPPKVLIEKYCVEIARNFNVHFEPNKGVLESEKGPKFDPDDFPPSPNGGNSPNGNNDGNCTCGLKTNAQVPNYITNGFQMHGKKLDYSNYSNSHLSYLNQDRLSTGRLTTTSGVLYFEHNGTSNIRGKTDGIEELTKRLNDLKKR